MARSTRVPRFLFLFCSVRNLSCSTKPAPGFRLVVDQKQGQGKSLVLVFGAPGGTRVLARSTRVPRFLFLFCSVRNLSCSTKPAPGFRLVVDQKQGQGKSLVLVFGAPGGTRTRDLLIRSQALYPAELRAHKRLSFKPPKYHITFGRELQLIFCGSCFSFLKLSGYGAALRNSRQISCCTLFISCYCFASAAAPRSPPHPETAYCFRPAPRRPPRGH